MSKRPSPRRKWKRTYKSLMRKGKGHKEAEQIATTTAGIWVDASNHKGQTQKGKRPLTTKKEGEPKDDDATPA